jgi:hypothetical protein
MDFCGVCHCCHPVVNPHPIVIVMLACSPIIPGLVTLFPSPRCGSWWSYYCVEELPLVLFMVVHPPPSSLSFVGHKHRALVFVTVEITSINRSVAKALKINPTSSGS